MARLVAELVDGRQCLPVGAAPPGFRRAVEDALAARQIRLRMIYDDPALDPWALLRREAELPRAEDRLPTGVWWVDGVGAARAEAWSAVARALGEAMRHDAPHRRALLVVPLPTDSPLVTGLDLAWLQAEPLDRVDLEVAARYRVATAECQGVLARLRIELSVEMASARLPGTGALDTLEHWMAASDEALCDPVRFLSHARADGAEPASAEFDLWRIHHAVLLGEIERERLVIVRANRGRWRIPYDIPETEGRPAKRVRTAELLELKYLYQQLRQSGEPLQSPLLSRLQMLREMRNALSHLEPASFAEVSALQAGTR
ncbi:hypothetical protein J8J14_21395 [Roseomonas sp. SSH11]|uniref:Uncharacterized protein n=1 Tax=Pararoseomonas baculiformis TaxID=2820812 RepID=A0ABS4AJY2_9PROT|nr:hypothetical protein [Pararoseomonas baculiformis]MBP0447327.1 hypothetical protein [Pararoseomonas baculiformis]